MGPEAISDRWWPQAQCVASSAKDAPPAAQSATVAYLGEVIDEVTVQGGRVAFGNTDRCGPYVFDFGGGQTKTFLVNLLDAGESRIQPAEEIPWENQTVAATTRAVKENREIWRYLVIIALAVLMVEWYVYNRRVYV